MKHKFYFLWFLNLLLCLFTGLDVRAQCTIACNDLVNVSLDQQGIAVVLPDMVLEGDSTSCPGTKSVNVQLPSGQYIGDTVYCAHAGDVLIVRVTDTNTGNFCWGSIRVEDKLPPVLTCQDTIVHCTADTSPDSLGLFSVSDNCDPDPSISFHDNITLLGCDTPYVSVILRTWTAYDSSGNAAIPCQQFIRLQRPQLSDVEFPADLDNIARPALPCESPDTSVTFTGFPMIDSLPVSGLCKIDVTYEDQVVSFCENDYTILREWLVLDCCSGEIITHTQVIKVMDMQPPVFDCPDTLYFGSNGPGCAGTFLLPPLPVSDNCADEVTIRTITPNGTIEDNGGLVFGLPLGPHTVIYEAQDACANFSNCEVTVIVEDVTAPVAICDEITTVSLNSAGTATIPAETFDDGSYDACCGTVGFLVRRMDEPDAPFSPSVVLDCDDLGDTVMVILQVSDCKGNTNSCMVGVIPDDKLPPSITCPGDITIACTEWLPAPPSLTGEPVVQENCSIDTLFYTDQENLDLCHVGTITRNFSVVDVSGFSAFCSQTITLIDTTESTFFFPADTVVDCSVPLDSISAGQVKVIADCELFGLNVADEIFPIECGLKIFRTYTFLDWCSGIDTSHTQFIMVIDTNPPVWDQPLGSLDTAYVCPGDLVKPPPPTATDFCTPSTVTLVMDTIVYMGCDNRYTRTFTYMAEDTCGNVAEPFVITLTVFDTLAPTADLPDMGPYACADDIPPFDPADVPAVDNCPGDVTVELLSETVPDNPCQDTLVRTYLLTDICGLDSIFSQNFIIRDTIAPTATPPVLGPFSCHEFLPAPDTAGFNAVDNCGGPVTITFISETEDPEACEGEVIRTWELTDECNNSRLVDQILLIEDTIPPTLTCPDSVVFGIITPVCTAELTIIIDAVDDCQNRLVTITNSLTNTGDSVTYEFPIGVTPLTFYARDECGNVDSCFVPVIVRDFVPPTNFCSAFNLNLDSNGIVVINLDTLLKEGIIGGEDVCSEVTFEMDIDTLDCDDYLMNFDPALMAAEFMYTVVVTDGYGNTSDCQNTIFLTDSMDICDNDPLVVGGLIFDENNHPMSNLEVQMEDDAGMMYAFTNDQGWYNFPDVPPGVSCLLKPYKNDDLLNGVTTFDLLRITKHILGIKPLTSPYKMIAADINNSGSITTFDLALLRKVILFVSDEFPNNTSWRFIRADHDFPDPSNPFAEPVPESVWLSNMTHDLYGYNFIAVKVGDVNGSVQVNFSGSVDERGGEEPFSLATDDQPLERGQLVEIPVYAEQAVNLAALQATLSYDESAMAFAAIRPATLDVGEKNYALPEPGSITLSWEDPDVRPVAIDDILYYLQFQIIENTSLSKALAINSSLTPAIAYEDGGNPLNVTWRIRGVAHTPPDAANFFILEQNRPNPFRDETKIRFYLAENMSVRLEVADLSGRIIPLLDRNLNGGWHEVIVDGSHFRGNGLYIYRLVTPYGATQKKMIYLMTND